MMLVMTMSSKKTRRRELIKAIKAICAERSVRGWVRKPMDGALTSIERAMVIIRGSVIIVTSAIGVIRIYNQR